MRPPPPDKIHREFNSTLFSKNSVTIPVTDDQIAAGRQRRACEIIAEARALGIELSEVWEERETLEP